MIDTVGQKVVHFYRILHQIHGVKNVIDDVTLKISSSSHQVYYDFTSYKHLKTDLTNEIYQFLSISINSHIVVCLRLLRLNGFHQNPNE